MKSYMCQDGEIQLFDSDCICGPNIYILNVIKTVARGGQGSTWTGFHDIGLHLETKNKIIQGNRNYNPAAFSSLHLQ